MSGRLILEYRADCGVTRIERDVKGQYSWTNPNRRELRDAAEAALESLLAAVKDEESDHV